MTKILFLFFTFWFLPRYIYFRCNPEALQIPILPDDEESDGTIVLGQKLGFPIWACDRAGCRFMEPRVKGDAMRRHCNADMFKGYRNIKGIIRDVT